MVLSLPLVSVITPTYNRADYLAETMDSILSQDYPNIECIVLDDGSTDNTAELIGRYTGRITYERHPNMGESGTVNKGWRMARGEYVTVVNSDDPLLPGMISTAVAYMEAHPEAVMCYPDWFVIDEHSRTIGPPQGMDCDYATMVRLWSCIPGPGAFLRRKALQLEPQRTRLYKYVADWEYWLRLARHGSLARITVPLATHRDHPGSACVAQNAKVGREIVRLAYDFFSRDGLTPEIRNLRRTALSAAYFQAAKRCAGRPWESWRYVLLSIGMDPKVCALRIRDHQFPPKWGPFAIKACAKAEWLKCWIKKKLISFKPSRIPLGLARAAFKVTLRSIRTLSSQLLTRTK